MRHLALTVLACLLALPAQAGSTMWSSGTANWFYMCANSEPMNIYIRHSDRTITPFALGPGQSLRTFVQRGDMVTWRCDARAVPFDEFIYVVTVP